MIWHKFTESIEYLPMVSCVRHLSIDKKLTPWIGTLNPSGVSLVCIGIYECIWLWYGFPSWPTGYVSQRCDSPASLAAFRTSFCIGSKILSGLSGPCTKSTTSATNPLDRKKQTPLGQFIPSEASPCQVDALIVSLFFKIKCWMLKLNSLECLPILPIPSPLIMRFRHHLLPGLGYQSRLAVVLGDAFLFFHAGHSCMHQFPAPGHGMVLLDQLDIWFNPLYIYKICMYIYIHTAMYNIFFFKKNMEYNIIKKYGI